MGAFNPEEQTAGAAMFRLLYGRSEENPFLDISGRRVRSEAANMNASYKSSTLGDITFAAACTSVGKPATIGLS